MENQKSIHPRLRGPLQIDRRCYGVAVDPDQDISAAETRPVTDAFDPHRFHPESSLDRARGPNHSIRHPGIDDQSQTGWNRHQHPL